MPIQSFLKTHDITWLVRKDMLGDLNKNISIQRKEVWDLDKKSNLIVSYLMGVPVENLLLEEDCDDSLEEKYKVIDGKNRTIATCQFVNNEFSLTNNIRWHMFDGIDIRGLTFSELPQRLQNTIKDYQVPFTIVRTLSEDERSLLFFMRNQAVPLSDMELFMSSLGETGMSKVKELNHHSFMTNKIKLGAPARRKNMDIRIIIEYFMLTNKENIGFSKLELQSFCDDIKENPSIIDVQLMTNIFDYLDKAFSKKRNYFNRANLCMIFFVANKALSVNTPPDRFAKWSDDLFASLAKDDRYKLLCKSYKATNIQERLSIITKNAKNNIL